MDNMKTVLVLSAMVCVQLHSSWGISCPTPNSCDVNYGTCELVDDFEVCSCYSGFALDEDGVTCSDIDECALGISGCEHNCHNTIGGAECSCNEGFTIRSPRTPFLCKDIDECMTDNGGCQTTCNNTEGSFICSCDRGYELWVDGKQCDINECSINNGGCEQICHNYLGGFSCDCNDGYELLSDHCSCADVEAPQFRHCPADVLVYVDGETRYVKVEWTEPRVSDNSRHVTVTSTHTSGDLFPLGEATKVMYQATDRARNAARCHFNVLVHLSPDGKCEIEDGLFAHMRHCHKYIIVDVEKKYNDAERFCGKYFVNGELAIIHNADTNDLLTNYLDQMQSDGTLDANGFWFGGAYSMSMTSGIAKRRALQSSVCYSNWKTFRFSGSSSEERSGSDSGHHSACTQLWSVTEPQWENIKCSHKNGFICGYVEEFAFLIDE